MNRTVNDYHEPRTITDCSVCGTTAADCRDMPQRCCDACWESRPEPFTNFEGHTPPRMRPGGASMNRTVAGSDEG